MTDLHTAAKLALEALTKNSDRVTEIRAKDQAITALREALAQPEQELVIDCPRCGHCCPQPAPVQEPFGYIKPGEGDYEKVFSFNRNERTGYTQAIYTTPQPPAQQEPVAWAIIGDGEWGEYTYGMHFENSAAPNHKYWEVRGYELQPLYTAPQPAPVAEPRKQEPVALETVYETVIQWDEGGGKRSRRELARRILALYAAHGIKENT